MIEFKNQFPRMSVDGKKVGTYNNIELGFPSVMTSSDCDLGMFIRGLRNSINSERALLFIEGKVLMVNKNWIRDYVHTAKAMRHWEYRLQPFYDFIVDTQRKDGQFYELIKQVDDPHWQFVNGDCYILYPEDNLSLVRLELEADIEYLMVEGAVYIYKTTGDNEWLKKVLPKLEKGINYITSDKKRWDSEHGLVMRPFTIDTWDFTDAPDSGTNRRINPNEPMSVMHGDNSGVYQAMNQLAWFNRRLGNEVVAKEWEKRAEVLRNNMFKYLWNGKFFMHQFHLNHNGIDDKECERLSLSNTYDINRGVTTQKQAKTIIEEYMERRKTTKASAEWFSIDPPYEKFQGCEKGSYVNGAISPFTAGELAKAAFNNGFEEYGWDIITRFMKIIERDGVAYFLYNTDLTPQPEGGPCAWGAAAFISAVDEGLAGINDAGVNYDEIFFAPKFPVTHYTELRYITGYEVSDTMVDVRYILTESGMRYDVYSPAEKITAHILLPKDKECTAVTVNGENVEFSSETVENSRYVNFVAFPDKKVSIEILF